MDLSTIKNKWKDGMNMKKLCPLKKFAPCTSDCAFYKDCKFDESGISVKFSTDKGKFACQFLEVLTFAKLSGSPIEYLKNTTLGSGKSLYDYLSEMGCNVEDMFERFEAAWENVDGRRKTI